MKALQYLDSLGEAQQTYLQLVGTEKVAVLL